MTTESARAIRDGLDRDRGVATLLEEIAGRVQYGPARRLAARAPTRNEIGLRT